MLENFVNNFIFDHKVKIILVSIIPTLEKIYRKYFYFETNHKTRITEINKDSFRNVIKFCQDFDIIPYSVSEKIIEVYWSIVVNNINNLNLEILISERFKEFDKNRLFKISNSNDEETTKFNEINKTLKCSEIGSVFTFYRFCIFLIHIAELSLLKEKLIINKVHKNFSHKKLSFKTNKNIDQELIKYISYDKNNKKYNNNCKIKFNDKSENFLFFLEKLNNSMGFLNFEKSLSLANSSKFSLLPNYKILNLIIPEIMNYSKDKRQIKCSIKEKNKKKIIPIMQDFKNSKQEIKLLDLNKILSIDEVSLKQFEAFIPQIIEIYEFYVSTFKCNKDKIFGDDNKNKMIFPAFFKFLDDIDLIKKEKTTGNSNYLLNDPSLNLESFKFSRLANEYRLTINDVTEIFSYLVSIKNINYSNSINNKITEASSNIVRNEKNVLLNNDFNYSNIDFSLFLKSFEKISLKLYWNKTNVDGLYSDSGHINEMIKASMKKFTKLKLPTIIKNFNIMKCLNSNKDSFINYNYKQAHYNFINQKIIVKNNSSIFIYLIYFILNYKFSKVI